MSDRGAMSERAVIVPGAPSDALRRDLVDWGVPFTCLGDDLVAGALPDPSRDGVVWLSPRARLDDALRAALRAFARGATTPRVGVAPHVAAVDGGFVPLGTRVVVADPGTVRFTGAGPEPLAVANTVRLDCVVRIEAPELVGEHLQAINEESTVAAALGACLGEKPRWKALAIAPVLGTLRGWAGARGDRRRAFTVAFLESFIAPATTAKLWERLNPETERAS